MLTFLNRTGEQLSTWWREVYDNVLNPKPDTAGDSRIAEEARGKAPVIWLLGMVGTGKSSIIRTLTGSGDAEVGTGYEPCCGEAGHRPLLASADEAFDHASGNLLCWDAGTLRPSIATCPEFLA